MTGLSDLPPGTIGFGPLANKRVTMLEEIGLFILGEEFDVGDLDIGHVFVVADNAVSPFPTCIEAMPSGAREYSMAGRWTPEYAYVMLPEDYPGQGADAAAIARLMIGTPYSFASYLYLAAWRFGWRTGKLEDRINRRKPPIPFMDHSRTVDGQAAAPNALRLPEEMICSVLADQAWTLAGKQVMPEGTPQQVVTPGGLAGHLLKVEGAKWYWPGS